MTTASASLHLPLNADNVWQLVGGFLSLPDWLPFIASSEAGEGGRLRTLTTETGEVIVERLETFDNRARTYTYSITQGPFAVTDYLATLQVNGISEHETEVVWSGRFTAQGICEAEAQALFQGIYEGGLTALDNHFKAEFK
jgi:hypothetical protein